jgi:predicted DNA-binding protein
MPTVSLKIPEALHRRLVAAARKAGKSKSALLREALEDHLNGAPALSAYDLAKDLLGSVRGGPPDLSTNPKYMEGFGE